MEKVSSEELLAINKRWLNGEKMIDLANEYGVKPPAIYNRLASLREKDKKLGRPNGADNKISAYDLEEIIKRKNNGESMQSISKDYECNISTLYYALQRLNGTVGKIKSKTKKSVQAWTPPTIHKNSSPKTETEFIDIPTIAISADHDRTVIIVCKTKTISQIIGELWK